MVSIAAIIATFATAATASMTQAQINEFVSQTNYHRCNHGAGPVQWDDKLGAKALAWANNLASQNVGLFHSKCYATYPYSGENLAWGSSSKYTITSAVNAWYNEYQLWVQQSGGNACNMNFHKVTGEFGHFTAMVWKGINRIGCAFVHGAGGNYAVCEYGSTSCMTETSASNGGSACWGGNPSNLPNFNMSQCTGNNGLGSECVQCLAQNSTCDAYLSGSSSTGASSSPATTAAPSNTSSSAVTTTPAPVSVQTSTAAPSTTQDAVYNRVLNCSYNELKSANDKCRAVNSNSFCQILAPTPTCYGASDVQCSC